MENEGPAPVAEPARIRNRAPDGYSAQTQFQPPGTAPAQKCVPPFSGYC